MSDDLRLIEDYLPIEAISAEASREKSVRKGHISTLHLWWARRPLVACRAAVYGALVPADRWVKDIDMKNPPADPAKAEATKNGKKRGLNRKAAKEFVTKLCRYPKTNPTADKDIKIKEETEQAIVEAQRHILEAHADRLTAELADLPAAPACAKHADRPSGGAAQAGAEGDRQWPSWVEEFNWPKDKIKVTYDDIVAGRAPRPRVLDMFAGGGAIPLEALRLGCEAYALDLNPVAHIIQLCTLVYPQKYGKPDPSAKGMTGPNGTWGGLAAEVRYWGNWVLDRVRKEIGDLYPPIPDPEVWDTPPEIAFDHETGQWIITKPGKAKTDITIESAAERGRTGKMFDDEDEAEADESPSAAVQLPPGLLQPVAYLWTRTVRCKNPACAATVPLVRSTWLCKKSSRYVALKAMPQREARKVIFSIAECTTPRDLEFDPDEGSKGGNATCPFCGTVADNDYVQSCGIAGSLRAQPTAIVAVRPGRTGKVFLPADMPASDMNDAGFETRLSKLAANGFSVPDEPINPLRPSPNARGLSAVTRYGMCRFADLFTPRQLVTNLTFCSAIRTVYESSLSAGTSRDHSRTVATYLGLAFNKVAEIGNSLGRWEPVAQCTRTAFGRHALSMLWDFGETAPIHQSAGNWREQLQRVLDSIALAADTTLPAHAVRGTATRIDHIASELMDGILTDPPYYDNVPYADVSDFFYVWLKRSISFLYPEHLTSELTPKRNEITALANRYGGNMSTATAEYESRMQAAFGEAFRCLKADAPMCVVYAHKTTLGWATLVDALRLAGFVVTEAWPLDTENASRLVAADASALASSITIVARKRPISASVGNYEGDVQPDLREIVRERVETLWDMGIAGADLVIACVGAGLRAFTKYEKVEYVNGEEVPAEKFLAEVEAVVLDTMLAKLSGAAGGNVSAVDNPSRFYVLWRYIYKTMELDAGEAIVFSNGTHIELDGPHGLSTGRDALVEKKKAKYRARDFTERGDNDKLGLPDGEGQPAPLIDVLHRVLWLMEHSPRKLAEFLDEARPDRERLRVLAQALAGAALSGKSDADAAKLVTTTTAEQAALGKLLANWRSLIESRLAADEDSLFGRKGR